MRLHKRINGVQNARCYVTPNGGLAVLDDTGRMIAYCRSASVANDTANSLPDMDWDWVRKDFRFVPNSR